MALGESRTSPISADVKRDPATPRSAEPPFGCNMSFEPWQLLLSCRRVDPRRATENHRVPAYGNPGAPREERQETDLAQRRPASSLGRQRQGLGSQALERD